MAAYDGIIRIITGIDTRGLRQGESDIRGSMERISDMAKKCAMVVASAFAVGTLTQFGKEAIQAASDLEAVESQFSQVFGGLKQNAKESLSQIAKEAGIAEERMTASYTKIAAFAKTTGMDTAGSMELANRAMVAVADSAAFYDRSLEETTESLQSFLKGNYENDAALGLSATEFTRNAAANKLYGKSFIELTEAQKQLTLLQMVEDANKLSGALGQASREADTWTNQTGNLNQAWTNLKANLGKFILPMAVQAVKSITNVINSLNAMLAKLYTAASEFRSFSELITGKKSEDSGSTGISKKEGQSIGSGYDAAAAGAENLADANEDAAKSAKEAGKAAKRQLSSLDKLNNISSKSSDSVATDAYSSESVEFGAIEEEEEEFKELGGIFDSIISKAKELAGLFKQGFFEGFGDYQTKFEEIKSNIISIGQKLIEIFTDSEILSAANNFANQTIYTLGQVTGSIASVGLTISQNLIGGIEGYLSQNSERIKQYIISMFDIRNDINNVIGSLSVTLADIFSVFGGDTAQQITGNLIGVFSEVGMMVSENATKLGRDILGTIAQPIIDNKDKIKEALEGTLQAIEPFTSGLLEAVQKVRDAVAEIYDEHLKPLFDSVSNGLSETLSKLLDGYNTYIAPVFQGLGERFKEIMEGPFGETVNKVKEFIGKLIDAVKLFWEEVLVPFFSWIADNIMPILAPIVDFIGNTVLTVFDTIIDIIGNIADVLGGIIDFIVGIFTGDWEKAWGGIKEVAEAQWNNLKDFFEGIVDIILNLINNWLEYIKANANAAWEGIRTITGDIWGKIKQKISDIWNGIKTLVSKAINNVKTTITNVWTTIKNTTTNVWNGIKGIFNGFTTFLTGVFTGNWKKAWDGIVKIFEGVKTSIKSVINGILGLIESLANGVINGINFVIGALNGLSFDVPKWVPLIGGETFGFNIPELKEVSIPRLATGTVVPPNNEFLAVLGDNKREPEVVSPLSTIEKAVENAMRRNGGIGGGEITIKIPVEIDGNVLFELIKKLDMQQFNRTGRPSFQI